MRFERLQIPAFGPFSNLDLEFRDKPLDLHVIYGANEAGKSSLLRAVRDLLFGIPAQSADNFLHDYSELRIKGEIGNRAGMRLVFQRRKGNKNTLLDAEGTQLPDNALFPFLGSVDQAYFSAMFGLGTRELHEGAQQLLRGEGDLGAALFSASLGGTPVQKVVAALQQEADQLFKGRATANVSIRPAANHYKELLRQSREAMVSSETWDRIEQALAKAGNEKTQLEAEIAKLQSELGWIQRCEDALPTVGGLGEEELKFAQIPPVPTLATDFVARASVARKAVSQAQGEVQRLTAQVSKLKAQLADCQTNPVVLAEADGVDQFHQDLGVYKGQKKALADYRVRLAGLEPNIRAGMQSLQLTGDFATLADRRIGSAAQLACEQAAEALRAGLEEQSNYTRKVEALQQQTGDLKLELQTLPETDLQGIRDALAVAAEATDADRTLAASETEVRRLTRETKSQHRQLAGAPADLEATARLPVPALATIRRYHEQMETIKRKLADQQEEVTEGQQRVETIATELTRLQRQGELPTEEALGRARAHRDHGWKLVLAEWKGGGAGEELVAGTPLEEAFPRTIVKADELADKLRLQADAVAQAEQKRAQLKECEKQISGAGQETLKLQGGLQQCQDAWQAEWSACGINPLSPLEMEEWRNQWAECLIRLEKLRAAEEVLERKSNQVQQAKQRLAAVLGQPEAKEFSLLYAAALKWVRDGEQEAGQRKRMNQQLQERERELAGHERSRAGLEKALAEATGKWQAQCAQVDLPAGASAAAGLKLLQERKALLTQFDAWRETSGQSQVTAQAIAQYEKAVGEKAAGLRLAGETTEAREAALWNALKQARQSQNRYDQLDEQIRDHAAELEEAQGQAKRSEQALTELIQLAGLTRTEELEPLLAHLERRDAIQKQMDTLRGILSGLARGQSVDEFVARVRAENPDRLAQRKTQAQTDRAEKEAALKAMNEALFQLRKEKQALEQAGDAAADFRQQAESCAATLKQDAASYLRRRLATRLLQSHIERFRKENQGPLLQKSGAVFQSTTRGAFIGLDADFNADDLPVLVGVRPDQSKVPVAGLSDGSRDQLYLALRLAALDRYLEAHEPMPLILDDLLITCDNERAKAILPQLSELSRRTQVFLFTHHEHLVDLCRQTLGEDQFQFHHLTTGTK